MPRVALVCDFVEEGWTSMDRVAEMLWESLEAATPRAWAAELVRPPMKRRVARLPFLGSSRIAFNADRFWNRYHDYPDVLRHLPPDLQIFHILDHSYAHLAGHLPPGRTLVTCHDLDAFRPLVERDRRFFPWQRKLAQRALDGLQQAAHVTCDSVSTCNELMSYGLVPPDRVSVVHNGVHPACSHRPDPEIDHKVEQWLGPVNSDPILLHVGSTIARKRIDTLLQTFAAVRRTYPKARLLRAGGTFTRQQEKLARKLGVREAVIVLPFVSPRLLAGVYRRASLLLQTSESEGFGLPVVEAMACATPVVASDLPVMREVGGSAATYCAVADVGAWDSTLQKLLAERAHCPALWYSRRRMALAQAQKFSWEENARHTALVYSRLAQSAQA